MTVYKIKELLRNNFLLSKLMKLNHRLRNERFLNRTISITHFNYNVKFSVPNKNVFSRVVNLKGEKYLIKLFLDNINPGDTIWDIGAYIGSYTIYSAIKSAPQGKVYSFEPEKKARNILTKNCMLNNLNNIQVVDYALGANNRESYLYASKDNSHGIHSIYYNESLKKHGVGIRIYSGDYLIQKLGFRIPKIIKIDVEGAELEVLEGMKDLLSNKDCRNVFIEIHPKILSSININMNNIMYLMKGSGFTQVHESSRGNEFHWVFKKEIND